MSTKILSPVFHALLCVFFLTARDFYFDLAQPSQNCSGPVKLMPRASYIRRNNFYLICYYRWTILLSISRGRPNLFRQYSFSSFPSWTFSPPGSFMLASWGFEPSRAYLFTFKYNVVLSFLHFLASSITLTPFFLMVILSLVDPIVAHFDTGIEMLKIFLTD